MTKYIFGKLKRRERQSSRRGQTLVEYALILAFISVVAILVLQQLGGEVTKVFETIRGKLQEARTGSTT
ncbi:Flp family type IVb pilin [Verrucomicrobia bacterium LW23]|nr:Flp family type IVb pilin [Verrucomicrobia bacterium LW23]